MPVSSKMAAYMSKRLKAVPSKKTTAQFRMGGEDHTDEGIPAFSENYSKNVKEEIKNEFAAAEMVRMSKKDLEEISTGKGKKAEAAANELSRRENKKEVKKGNKDIDPESVRPADVTNMRKAFSRAQDREPEDLKEKHKELSKRQTAIMEKAREEGKLSEWLDGKYTDYDKKAYMEGMAKGGMVKKKPAAKKAAPAKTKSRSSPYNKYYGK